MERLKSIKESLIAQVQNQMGHLQSVDAKELGEVVDMIKDIEEAIYYCTVTKAMEENKASDSPKYYRDMDREYGRLYYPNTSGGQTSSRSSGMDEGMGGNGRTSAYYSEAYPLTVHDYREGRSPRMRKMYMESKEMHKDMPKKMHELEEYMKELSVDITEMIADSTPEEKQMLKQKLTDLTTKF